MSQYIIIASFDSIDARVTNSGCKRCNFMKTDEIICDAGANGTNSRVEVMQNVSKIS